MNELKEIRFNETDILLQDNLVRSSILPETAAELNRNVIFKGNTVVEGPVYGHRLEIQQGNLEIQGAVFAQFELYVNSEAAGNITFKKSVGSANAIVSRASNCRLMFYSDVNAKSVSLNNAFVAGSIYADEVELENCVVIGGVFATQKANLINSIIGTFNTPSIMISGIVNLLLPSAFSVEKMMVASGTRLYNLCLADLGSLYKGLPQSPNSGKIALDTTADEVTTKLTDDQVQVTLRSYTVIGKVLAADLLDMDKFQNHFLLTAASLGAQLLKSYDMGLDKDGNTAVLSMDRIRDFFFDILQGKIEIQDMDGKFSISQIAGRK